LDSESNSEKLTSLIDPLTLHGVLSHSNDTDIDHKSLNLNSVENILTSIESMYKPSLLDLANLHGVKPLTKMSADDLKNMLSDHLCKGGCLFSTFEGCKEVTATINSTLSKKKIEESNDLDCCQVDSLFIFLLSYLLPKIKLRPLRRLLTQHKIYFSLTDNLSCLRRRLKAFIKSFKKGKHREDKKAAQMAMEIEKKKRAKLVIWKYMNHGHK
jgi:hypothetical protein